MDRRAIDITQGMDPVRKREMLKSLARDRAREPGVPQGKAAAAPRHDQGTDMYPAHQPGSREGESRGDMGARFMHGRLPGGHQGAAQHANREPRRDAHPATVARQNQIPVTAQQGQRGSMNMHPALERRQGTQQFNPSQERRQPSGQYVGGAWGGLGNTVGGNQDNDNAPGY